MKPFEKKWACYSVPMKALTPNGYDVIMASEMLGHIAPTAVDQKQQNNIKLISDNTLWEKCELSIQQSLNCFVEHGVNLPIKEYAFTILLANAKNPYIILKMVTVVMVVFQDIFFLGYYLMNTLYHIFM